MATPRLTNGQVTEGISAKPRCWTATSTVAATAGERQLPQLPDGTALPTSEGQLTRRAVIPAEPARRVLTPQDDEMLTDPDGVQ